jgi:hypothetical protein
VARESTAAREVDREADRGFRERILVSSPSPRLGVAATETRRERWKERSVKSAISHADTQNPAQPIIHDVSLGALPAKRSRASLAPSAKPRTKRTGLLG